MTPDRFRHLAAVHGADLERWPHAEKAAAARLLRAVPDLHDDLDEAAAVDAALRLIVPPVADARGDRVAAAVLERIDAVAVDPLTLPWHPPHALWPALGLMLGMGLLGFVAGSGPAAADALPVPLSDLVAFDSLSISLEP